MKFIQKVPICSIITPSYNQGEFLAATIKNVISHAIRFFIEVKQEPYAEEQE